MSFLKKLFGQEPPVAAPAAEPTEQQKSKAEFHRDRFARAIPECRAAAAAMRPTMAADMASAMAIGISEGD